VTATVAAHGYNSGIQVTIQNALPMEYNGVFTITVIDANSFSYPLPSNPGAAIAKGQVTNNVINSMQYGDLMTGSGSPMGFKTPDFIGQRYRDATNNRAYIALTMSNSGWGTIGEQARVQSGPITGNYTTRPGDNLLEVDCTTGPVTITLGTAASNSGTELKIVKIDSSANSVSFTKQSSTDSLIGVASLTAQGAGLRLTSNGLASSQGRWTAG
jgi:hypothetical protein